MSLNKITTCLWFNTEGEAAAKHYTSIFANSSIDHIQYYVAGGQEIHGKPAGSVMTVSFTLNGHSFVALNGGPYCKHSEAVSFQIECKNQAEVDHYWEKLSEGGDEEKLQCGWLADKFGVSWQVVPKQLLEYLKEGSKEQQSRVTNAMLKMKKMNIEGLRKAFDGEE